MGAFMRDSDAFSWYMERDPILRSTVVVIAWLEHSPDWAEFAERLEHATRQVPGFRQRVLEPPGRLATPRWTFDDEFDFSWHLRRMEAPPPRGPETVVEFARQTAMTAFDRSRPLWQFTLIEHVRGGRAALVMKVHHSLTDGLGGMELALLLFDTEEHPEGRRRVPDAPAGERIGAPALIRQSIASSVGRASDIAGTWARGALPTAVRFAGQPLRTAGSLVETARSIGRTVAPVLETASPIMRGRGLGRHLDIVDVTFADLKKAAVFAGGTLNDAFLASVTGGLRRYHEHHDAPVDYLRVTLPISIRRPEDPAGGNRITLIRFPLPVSDPDPVSRMAAMDRACRAARDERSLEYTNGIAGALNLLPQAAVGAMLKRVDFLASDVPGYNFPVYLAGARLERYTPFGPTIGAAANFTLLSYDGKCSIGVTMDTAAVPDGELFMGCIRAGFEEVLALAGAHEPVRLPLHDRVRAAAA